MSARSACLLVLPFVVMCECALAQGNQTRFSLSDVVALARRNSPRIHQMEAKIAAALQREKGARAIAGPSVSLAEHAGRDTGGLDEDVLVTQVYELGDKRKNRARTARAETAAARSEKADVELDVENEARSGYFEALRAEADRKLAAESLENARAFLKAAEIQFNAGDVARSNVVRSQIEVTRAEQALDAAETESANRLAALRSLTGLPEDRPIELADALDYTAGEYRLADLETLAIKSRPDLQAARFLVASKQAALRAAKSATQPDLFVEGRRERIDFSGGSSVRGGVTFPLWDVGRSSAIHAAEADVRDQQAAQDQLERTARLEVQTAYRNLIQAQRTIDSFRKGRLDRAKDLLTMAQTGYEKGGSSYIELLDARQVYRTEQTEYTRALAAANIAKAALQKAVGGRFP